MDVLTMISSVGFPIVACLGVGYYVKYQDDKHREEIGKLSEVVQNNTVVLQKLCDYIMKGGKN